MEINPIIVVLPGDKSHEHRVNNLTRDDKMANLYLGQILKLGPRISNQWREKNEDIIFKNADLRNVEFYKANLSGGIWSMQTSKTPTFLIPT
jgi:uncharacterized protein YjbI with pentapeptide repeats